MCFGIAQRGEFWEEGKFLDTILGKSRRSYRYFVIENRKLHF